MESLNLIKGYGKVNPEDDRPNPPPNRHRKIIIAFSLAVLLLMTVAIGTLLVAVIIESATESEESEPSQLASTSAHSLRTICAVTRYPDSCFSSISLLNSPPSNDPLRFFNLSLQVSTIALSSLKTGLSEPEADPAVKDCAELFDDAASQLGRSSESIRVERVLTEARISDLRTWISAAMTDQETCLDGLAETGSAAGGEFWVSVQKSQEYTSNTLAILSNITSLFKKFGLPMP